MNPETKKPLPPFLGPLVLATDTAMAAIVWFLRNDLLGASSDTDMIAGIVAGCLVVGGIVAFFIFRNLSRTVL